MKGKSTKVWLAVIGLLLVVGVAGMAFVQSARETGGEILITWNDQEEGVYPLSEDRTFIYEGEQGQYNKVVIQGGMVFMEEANCPDQICVKHAPTDQSADPIVCLPNNLVVEVLAPGNQ